MIPAQLWHFIPPSGFDMSPSPSASTLPAAVPPLVLTTTEGPLDLSRPGGPLVLYAYPEDDTEGCTIENIEFSALSEVFAASGLMLCGLSPDSLETHEKFIQKRGLKVRLAADPGHGAIEALGLWQLKKMYGVEFMGVRRATLLITPDGRIADMVLAPRIKGHAEKVLARARSLFAEG